MVTEMIRVSNSKPRITRAVGRWNEDLPYKSFYVNDFGWVCVNMWSKLQHYQSSQKPWFALDLENYRIRKMKLSPSGEVWEFDALDRTLDGHVRFVAFFERPGIIRWTWWDANVVYWSLRLVAWLRTKINL